MSIEITFENSDYKFDANKVQPYTEEYLNLKYSINDDNNRFEFPTGDINESNGFIIETNKKVIQYDDNEPCKHCHTIETKNRRLFYFEGEEQNKSEDFYKTWVCPRVLIGNGYEANDFCLDCILEAVQTLPI